MAVRIRRPCSERESAARLNGSIDEDVLSPEEQIARRELLATVEGALEALTPVQSALVRGCFFEGKTLEQSAPGLSKSWASRQLARAIDIIRDVLVRAGYGDMVAAYALPAGSAAPTTS